MIIDVHVMLIAGFGFLMNFLRKFGFSSLGFTMLITCVVTQWTVLLAGLVKMGDDNTVKIGFMEYVDLAHLFDQKKLI